MAVAVLNQRQEGEAASRKLAELEAQRDENNDDLFTYDLHQYGHPGFQEISDGSSMRTWDVPTKLKLAEGFSSEFVSHDHKLGLAVNVSETASASPSNTKTRRTERRISLMSGQRVQSARICRT